LNINIKVSFLFFKLLILYNYNDMKRIRTILNSLKGGVIAFSGGKDSLTLCLLAREIFGKNYLCVTVKFPYTHNWTVEKARELAKRFSLNHRVLELPMPYELRENQPLRCYWCKKRMFQALKKYTKRGWKVMEGSVYSEEGREGLRAAWEEGVISPFIKARVGNRAIKKYLTEVGVEDIPSETCLLTRIPRWEKVDIETLKKIERLEDFLRENGITKVRARWHRGLIRIEIERKNLKKAFKIKEKIVREGKSLGFSFVTLDLAGYKEGSMNY